MARTYTDADRISALAALEVNAGNVSRASRAVGIPRATIQLWRSEAVAATPALAETLAPVGTEKTDWPGIFASALHEAVAQLRQKLPDMNGRDTAITVGILSDKLLDHRDGRKGSEVNVNASASAGVIIQRNTPGLSGG